MNGWKKLLAMLLCAAMCISMFPTWAFAEGEIEPGIDSAGAEAIEAPDADVPQEEEQPQHEHVYNPTVIDPTCTEQGYTVYTCECGDSYVSDYTDALNHPEIHEIAEVPATCTTDGVTAGKRCAVCGETVEGFETIPATGHIPVEVAEVPATTESTGTAAGTKCAVCGEILNGCEVIPAVQPETTAEPEPISDLSQGDQDANQAAGEVVTQAELTEETSSHKHSYTATVTAPTCTEQGYTTYTCECGDSYVADYIDALRHPEIIDIPEVPASETENGTTAGKQCTLCGEVIEGCEEIPIAQKLTASGKDESSRNAVDGVVSSGKCGENLTWALNSAGILTISGNGEMWDMRDEGGIYDYHPCPWETYKGQILELVIEDGVTSTGADAFFGCENLKKASFPKTLETIGAFCFMYCSQLKDFTLPDSLTSLCQQAFNYTAVTTVIIPASVTFLDNAFSNCESLLSVYIDGDLQHGGGVTSLGGLFAFCPDLQRIEVSPNHFCLCSYDGVLYRKDGCLDTYPAGRTSMSYEVVDGTKEIASYAFWGASGCLKELVIPASVESIADHVWNYGCTLTITFAGNSPLFADEVFEGMDVTVYYPEYGNGWEETKKLNYGGTVTWNPYSLEIPVLTEAFNSATGVRVSWNAVNGAVKYRLLRKNLTKGETGWTNVGETANLTLIDNTVSPANRYTYSVRAIGVNGKAGACDETGRTCTYIAKADITTLRAGVKGVTIGWSKPTGAKKFRVMRRPDGTNSWTVIAVVEGTSYTDTTAPKGVKLWYTVRGVSMDNRVLINSYNGTGWSLYHVNPPVMTEAFNSATGVRVSWNPVMGAAKYRLLRKNVTAGETSWTAIGETKDLTLIDKSAVSAQRYTYTVECIDSNGRTSSAQNPTGRTCTYIAMAKITEIKGVTNGVSLTWSKPAGAKNFRVFRKTDGSSTWTAIKDIQGTTYTDTTAKKNVKYWYTVRAITLAGDMYINSYNATGWSVTRK